MNYLKLKLKQSFVFRLFCLVFMMVQFFGAYAQSIVRGVVKGDKNEPVVGATIKVVGSNKRVVTDADGNFRFDVEKLPVSIDVSHIGNLSKRVNITSSNPYTIVMDNDASEIDEVMVVAYGTQKKSTMVGAVAQIKGDELKKAPAMNLTNTLAGRLPGLTTLQQSGRPGADNASLYVRGIGTYGSNRSPLIIVDGVERPASTLANLDPNEVESISILKDAVAKAAYGVQAANGIILVKTKSGSIGETRVSYDFSYGLGRNTRLPKFLNGPDYMAWYNKGIEMDNDALVNNNQSEVAYPYSQEMIDALRNGTNTNPLLGDTDWMGILAGKDSHTQHHSLTLSGGANNTQYFAAVNHLNQDGVINNTGYKRYNVRTNINSKISEYLNVGVNLSARQQHTKTPGISPDNTAYMNPWYQASRMLPNIPMFAPNGLYTSINNGAGLMSPIASVEQSGYQRYLNNVFQGQANLDFYVPGVKGLVAKVQGSYDFNSVETKSWAQPYSTMMRQPHQTSGDFGIQYTVPGITVTRLTQNYSKDSRKSLQASLAYNNVFNEDHVVGGLVLYEFSRTSGNSFGAGMTRFPITLIHELDYGSQDPEHFIKPGGSSAAETARAGLVAKFNYAYQDKYLVEFATRWDASANFPKYNRWKMFPGAGLGWVISKEDFFSEVSAVEFLKLKASYGKSGNDRLPQLDFPYLSTFVPTTSPVVVIDGKPISALYTSNIPNPNLKWEESTMFNVGFETRFLEKFSFDFDWFYQLRTGILGSVAGLYPPSIGGYVLALANIGEVDNRGFDAQLKYNDQFGDLRLNVTGNINWARNRYLKYDEAPGTPAHLSVIGRSIGEKRGYVTDGFVETWEEARNTASPSSGIIAPGFFRFKDLNGDGRLTSTGDRTFIGRSNVPELMFGLDINLAYKGFDFSALLQGAALADVSLAGTYEGSVNVNGVDDNTVWTKSFYGNGNSPYFLLENAWRPDNPNAEFPRLTANAVTLSPHNANANSSWIRKGDYLRLKSAQLGYSLPSSILGKAKISNLRLFVSGSNLFTWDHLKYLDPEMPNVTLGFYPQQRIYEFGVNVTF